MRLQININNKPIYEAGDDTFMCTVENPSCGLTLYTPNVSGAWNRSSDYADNFYNLIISAPTNLDLTYSDKGLYWKVGFRILGFGFSFYKQACY